MFNSTPYYHQTTSKMLKIFNTLFNNIHVGKWSNGAVKEYQKVPISYGPRSKWLERIEKRENLDDSKIAIILPRMSYEMNGLTFDSTRKINKLNRWRLSDIDDVSELQYVGIPYNMDVTMSIASKTEDQMFQIIEQIVPLFRQGFTLRVKGLDGPSTKVTNVPIYLTSVTPDTQYQGTAEERNIIVWTLTFTIKLSYAGPVTSSGLIRQAEVSIFDDPKDEGEKITISVGENDTSESYTITQTITNVFEDDS